MSLGNHCQDSHVLKCADACVPDIQHCSSLHTQSTDIAHSNLHRAPGISAATVTCMVAVLQHIESNDKRKHLDMSSTDKENFQPKVG